MDELLFVFSILELLETFFFHYLFFICTFFILQFLKCNKTFYFYFFFIWRIKLNFNRKKSMAKNRNIVYALWFFHQRYISGCLVDSFMIACSDVFSVYHNHSTGSWDWETNQIFLLKNQCAFMRNLYVYWILYTNYTQFIDILRLWYSLFCCSVIKEKKNFGRESEINRIFEVIWINWFCEWTRLKAYFDFAFHFLDKCSYSPSNKKKKYEINRKDSHMGSTHVWRTGHTANEILHYLMRRLHEPKNNSHTQNWYGPSEKVWMHVGKQSIVSINKVENAELKILVSRIGESKKEVKWMLPMQTKSFVRSFTLPNVVIRVQHMIFLCQFYTFLILFLFFFLVNTIK